MFIITLKTNKGKLICAIIAILILFGLLMFLIFSGISEQTFTVSADVKYNVSAKNNMQRIEFLEQFGWKTSEEAIEIRQVTVPQTFNDTYELYNEIQISQGLNLKKYCGKNIKSYTYDILNYPDANGDVIRANLLVYKNRVIGGDICSVKFDGFMQNFFANSKIDINKNNTDINISSLPEEISSDADLEEQTQEIESEIIDNDIDEDTDTETDTKVEIEIEVPTVGTSVQDNSPEIDDEVM